MATATVMRIAIDPNVRTAGNQTRCGIEDLFGDIDELNVGDAITVMCLETDIIGDATVARIDLDSKRRLIFLDVDWESLRREDFQQEQHGHNSGYMRGGWAHAVGPSSR